MNVHDLKNAKPGSVKIVDIRKAPDDRQIPGSQQLSGESLESGDVPFSKNEHVVLYCGSGNSCSRIAQSLHEKGYATEALEGGYAAWRDAGLPTEPRR
ncbi:MAG TPA: rhodanese-like domain-containing protein [Candidatus Rubrimentiphilum sp.]|nr:rhodanese-like domain-containing protein [Candidatus Rubrimentiphilum sp.]